MAGSDFRIPEDPTAQNDLFVEVFNSGDGAHFDSMYADDAISNMSGAPLTGAARTTFFKEFLAAGPRIDSKVLQTFTTGDTSLLIVDYSLDIPGEEGVTRVSGVCTDVLVRDESGNWTMAVDRPVPTEPAEHGNG